MIYIDVSAEMAQFKNHFYNSSIVTHSFFPRTSVIGFLAGILEYDHDSYHEYFKEALIGISLRTPVYKEIKTVNFIKGDTFAKDFHSQMRMEYLKGVDERRICYRLFYSGKQESKLLTNIKSGKGYHRYLGTTECIATIDDFGKIEAELTIQPEKYNMKTGIFVSSIVPAETIQDIFMAEDDKLFNYEKTRIIYAFDNGRKSKGVVDIISETKQGKIFASFKNNLEFRIAVIKEINNGLEEMKDILIKGSLVEVKINNIKENIFVF